MIIAQIIKLISPFRIVLPPDWPKSPQGLLKTTDSPTLLQTVMSRIEVWAYIFRKSLSDSETDLESLT